MIASPSKAGWLIALGVPLAVYLLALNPWFAPDQHDDVLYFFGGESIKETGVFAFDGVPITDWPPLLSLVLSAVFAVFGASIYAAKFVIILTAAGLGMIWKYAKMRDEAYPVFLVLIVGLVPISLRSGAGILSEWPYMFASFAFFCVLGTLGKDRRWRWAMLAGALLAVASLTRFLGVFLGVAIVVQAFLIFFRHRSFRAVAPEFLVAVIGAVPWLLWKFRCLSVIRSGEAPVGVYSQTGHYFERFSDFDFFEFISIVEDTIFSIGRAARGLVEAPSLGWIAAGFCIALVVTGVVVRFRSGQIAPADWYALAALLLFLVDLEKNERYFFPITPFLVMYVISAVQEIAKLTGGRSTKVLPATVLGCWAAWMLLLCVVQLFRGNMTGNRGGFSLLASPTIEDYYKGDALDMLHAIRSADGVGKEGEVVGTVGFHGKYIYAFTRRSFVLLDGEEPRAVRVFIVKGDLTPPAKFVAESPMEVGKFGEYRVFAGD